MTSKISKLILIALNIIAISILILISLNSFHSSDDYCLKGNISSYGFWQLAYHHYLSWDGRSFSAAYLFRNYLLDSFNPEFIGLFATLSLIFIALLIALMILRILNYKGFELRYTWFQCIAFYTPLLTIGLWITMRPILARVLYQPTATFYSFANLLMIFAVYYLIKSNNFFLQCFFIFAASLSGVNLAFGLISFMVIARFLNLLKLSRKKTLVVILIAFIGFIICGLAPGNFHRAESGRSVFIFDVIEIARGFFLILSEYSLMSKGVLLAAPILSVYLLSLKIYPQFESSFEKKWIIVFFLSAISTIIPFLIAPSTASKHTAIHFQTFVLIGFSLLFYYVFGRVKGIMNLAKFYPWLIIGGTIGFILIGKYQLSVGTVIKRKVEERFTDIRNHAGQKRVPLTFEYIEQPPDFFANRLLELAPDSLFWENNCVQKFYNTGGIRVIPSDSIQ